MIDYPTKIDVAFHASVFRNELDELLRRHNARLLLGWNGKWAKLQVMFPQASQETVVTLAETRKGGLIRYVMQEEEVPKKK